GSARSPMWSAVGGPWYRRSQPPQLAPREEHTSGERRPNPPPRAWAAHRPPEESEMSDLPPDFFNRPVADIDPEVADAMGLELQRQQRTLEMIASENFVPQAILDCQGSVLTNQYAEGYPGERYYVGGEYVDI